MFSKKSLPIFLLLILTLLSAGLIGCAANSNNGQAGSDVSGLTMASMDMMPASVQSQPVMVQQAYQFAVANPDVLKQIPCYCGCGSMGHTSNYSCYVEGVDAQGKITFDNHAQGCGVCVDITQDTMRLMKQGKSVGEIRTYIDNTYSKYGTSNIK